MNSTRIRLASLVPAAALVVAAGSIAVHASSAASTVKLAPNASLANPPNSVIVGVDYSCMPSQFSYGSVNVDQSQSTGAASGSRIDVSGFGNFQPVCDDKAHHAEVIVSSWSWFYPPSSFIAGPASASAFVGSGAAYANTSAEIAIK